MKLLIVYGRKFYSYGPTKKGEYAGDIFTLSGNTDLKSISVLINLI